MKDKTSLALFMTWGVSLAVWRDKGLLQREVKLYQALAESGVEVTFLSWGGDEDRDVADSLHPAIKTISLYNHIPRPKNKALRALSSLLVPWYLRKQLKGVDILKTNQMWGGWVAAIASLTLRTPLIARCGFELYDFTRRQNHSAMRRAFIWMISRFTYGAARHICVATREDKAFVTKHFGQADKKISLHPNWIDTEFFAPQNMNKKENHILFVGRLSKQKNLPMLIDALKGSDIVLDIVGQGELKDALEKQASINDVKVNFLGSRPNDELPAIYNAYPAFVLPSHYEGNPKTLLEAMACGAAVIGSDVSGIASVIEHGQSGLLSAPNSDALKGVIKSLMADSELRAKLGENARNQIIETQTLDRLVSKELKLYRGIKT